MKMMKYDNLACEVEVTEHFLLKGNELCPFHRDTLAYALERLFSRNDKARKHCTYISWQLRLAKGKQARRRDLSCLIPGHLLELGSCWFWVRGYIDSKGVHITSVDFTLKQKPQICPPKECIVPVS